MKKLITLSIIAFSSFICNAQNFFTDGLFGNNGYSYSTQLGAIEGRSENLFKQPDGKFLLCGYIYDIGCNCYYNVMFRTDECGQVDSSFGTNGLVRHTFDQRNAGYAYTLKDDGKIIAVGLQSDGNAGSQQFPFIARYTSDGIPDSSFATFGTNKISSLGPVAFTSVYPLDSGKFLCTNGLFLMRFDSLGFADAAFGSGGNISYPTPPGINFFYNSRSVLRSDGKIISTAAAYSGINNDKNATFLCYDTLGLIDSTYGSNGFYKDNNFVIGSDAPLLILQSDDKVVTAQAISGNDIILARYLTNGSLDSTFGVNGYTMVTGADVRLEYLSSFPDNSFVIGYGQNGIPTQFYKFTSDGISDPLFSLDGSNSFQFPAPSSEKADIGFALSNEEFIVGTSSAFNGGSMVLKKYGILSSTPNITQNIDSLFANVSDPSATLQWYLNGASISGAIDNLYITTQNGTYVVEVTNSLGCSATDTIVVTNTGIAEHGIEGLVSFYPNPVKDFMTYENRLGRAASISLFDIGGKLMLTNEMVIGTGKVDMSVLPAGVYMVEVKTDIAVSKTRILKH